MLLYYVAPNWMEKSACHQHHSHFLLVFFLLLLLNHLSLLSAAEEGEMVFLLLFQRNFYLLISVIAFSDCNASLEEYLYTQKSGQTSVGEHCVHCEHFSLHYHLWLLL